MSSNSNVPVQRVESDAPEPKAPEAPTVSGPPRLVPCDNTDTETDAGDWRAEPLFRAM